MSFSIKKASKSNLSYIMILALIAIVPITKLIDIHLLSLIVSGIVLVFVFLSPWYETVYLLFGLCFFEYDLAISWWIVVAVAIVKLLFAKLQIRTNILFCLLTLITIEIVHLNISAYLFVATYFCLIIMHSKNDIFDKEQFCRIQNFAYLCAVIAVIVSEGSIQNVIQAFEDSSIIRFGEFVSIANGTMGLTLGGILVLCFNICTYLDKQQSISKVENVFRTIISMLALLIGILTMSRIFIVCVAIIVLALLAVVFEGRKKSGRLLIIVLMVGVILFIGYSNEMITYIGKITMRSIADSGVGIRGNIWESCFGYLNAHPTGWIIGYGSLYSSEIGITNNMYFQYMAHNVIIDTIMTSGLLGFLIMILLSSHTIKYFRTGTFKAITVKNMIYTVPLWVYLTYGMTALSLTELKTWIILFVCLFYFSRTGGNTEWHQN